nr:MAG TPA: hypothetical protein [Caudoviricetes sp.]
MSILFFSFQNFLLKYIIEMLRFLNIYANIKLLEV